MLRRLDDSLDVYEYTDGSGGPALSTDDPFDPYANWWTRVRAGAAAYGETITGQRRDLLFGDRAGEFWLFLLERGLLAPAGRPDEEFERRWLLRESATGRCWLADFDPKLFDAPLDHIECYAKRLIPPPDNLD